MFEKAWPKALAQALRRAGARAAHAVAFMARSVGAPADRPGTGGDSFGLGHAVRESEDRGRSGMRGAGGTA